jgi:hypothetical protein
LVSVVLKECLYCGQIGEKAELPVYWVRKERVKRGIGELAIGR